VALGLFGWVFALAVAIPTGIYGAVRKDKLGDAVSRFVIGRRRELGSDALRDLLAASPLEVPATLVEADNSHFKRLPPAPEVIERNRT